MEGGLRPSPGNRYSLRIVRRGAVIHPMAISLGAGLASRGRFPYPDSRNRGRWTEGVEAIPKSSKGALPILRRVELVEGRPQT